jgi:hypothetical protein
MADMPQWAEFTKGMLFDCHPEYCAEPYPHLVLIETVFGTEEYWATLDTYGDVMHIAFRSGAYAGMEVGDRTPGDIALWFETKVTECFDDELVALRHEILEAKGL